jgi:hypothetical protein
LPDESNNDHHSRGYLRRSSLKGIHNYEDETDLRPKSRGDHHPLVVRLCTYPGQEIDAKANDVVGPKCPDGRETDEYLIYDPNEIANDIQDVEDQSSPLRIAAAAFEKYQEMRSMDKRIVDR